jgi:hypothetical protein
MQVAGRPAGEAGLGRGIADEANPDGRPAVIVRSECPDPPIVQVLLTGQPTSPNAGRDESPRRVSKAGHTRSPGSDIVASATVEGLVMRIPAAGSRRLLRAAVVLKSTADEREGGR